MRGRWLVVLLVIGVLLAPTALASHNMGHRYLVHGRILDSAGMPVQNQEVEIRLMRDGTYQSSLISRTDCFGDFDSWKAIREGPVGAAEHGAGEIEGPLAVPGQQGVSYYNFHFHDEFLSSRNKFELRMLNNTWEIGFNSKTRQTNTFHQLDSVAPPAAACGGYDEFNSTFTVRVFVSHVSEMTSSGEPTAPPRDFTVQYAGVEQAGRADFMSTYVAKLRNVTVTPGQNVEIEGTTLGSKSESVSDEEAKYRRLDSINAVSGGAAAGFGGLKILGIVVLVAVVLIALYIGMQKMKTKREEARLLEGSTRRRFRKGRGGPGGES